ncbi:MAG: hypothetical protein ACLFRE_03830 [Desulfovermiculus sp.]
MLQKMARQLASMDEASLMALWDTYHSRVKAFEPTRTWEEACIIFGLIQAVRWKNQLFNNLWAEQKQAGEQTEQTAGQSMEQAENQDADLISNSERGKIIQFYPRGE